ncbi:DinB superfamily protein [Botrimarina colliarenosi]|uniref:DinB superfamily protein n=1 Tax=Botrimarina colliarenosi TaxID=2528001 RepID=A0A5C6A4D3_9BACT|nr:DUF1572 family protein [Botrimarina colliarenosi]TWT94802.1 DinB superfamily protein [Botrimarina colliarenosi]
MNDPTNEKLGLLWLDEVTRVWRRNKEHADAAITQLSEAQLRQTLAPEVNSVAVVMKHVAGNLRSRWSGFLTTDGEKPDRGRDREFVDDYPSRDAMLADWEDGWRVLFEELGSLTPASTLRTVEIRGCQLSVPEAILRSISHCSYHIGQIVQTARVVAGDDWVTLTIPRGESESFNQERWGRG